MALDVLLLEDDPSKKNKLLAFLNRERELFSRVDTVLCTADAIMKMHERQYDLFISDVVVPLELGGDRSEENCVSMFMEIDDGYDGVLPPHFSLPISASREISTGAFDFFKGRPWGILPYDESTGECILAVEKVARFVLQEKARMERDAGSSCDVFLISALMEPEFSAVEALDLNWGPLEPLDASQLIRFGSFAVEGKTYSVAAGFCARMGPVAAAALTEKVILMLKPKLIIMAGICAGIPEKAAIGDVIAADISWDWQSGKCIDRNGVEGFEIAPHQITIDVVSKKQLILLKRDKEFWESLALLAVKAKTALPKLLIGPMASGASVLADARVVDRIKQTQHKNVVGLDMEAYAVFAAAECRASPVRVMSLKAVCDNGDIKKNDEHQEYAAKVSAAAVDCLLKKYAGPLLE